MTQKSILVLSSIDVSNIISRLSVPDLVQTIQASLFSFSRDAEKNASTPHRSSIQSPTHNMLFMPSRVESLATTTVKVASVPKVSGEGGLPATTLLMDEHTGGVEAVVNSRILTALRTAAASTLATTLCMRTNNTVPTDLLLFGAGGQSNAHASLLIATFPTIRRCTVVNRSYNNRFFQLLGDLREKFPFVKFIGLSGDALAHGQSNVTIERAVRSASIICTATSSTKPLFPAEWVSAGAHLNLIGSYTPAMHEVSSELFQRAKIVIVDSRVACAREAGELIEAQVPAGKIFELGECGPQLDARTFGEGDIFIYKSVGVGVMDVAVTRYVVDKAKELGVGTLVPYD